MSQIERNTQLNDNQVNNGVFLNVEGLTTLPGFIVTTLMMERIHSDDLTRTLIHNRGIGTIARKELMPLMMKRNIMRMIGVARSMTLEKEVRDGQAAPDLL
ncbi:hypothetical protein HAX54_053305 [Datura stramonium]|uniref:Uncharacterized protein n=1 Tax=Datura stramonium TaxID=4076 RepID=A0ABS8T0W5_DATST|nr:hypothetical protein [Datura stramonium]